MICNLEYIPSHLHTVDKPTVNQFSIGEKLFYRCLPQNLAKPYDTISLKDISHNRNFCDDDRYGSENVFYNVLEDDNREKYDGYNFVTIIVNNLEENTTYTKEFIKVNHLNETVRIILTLKHSPIACMYPHSVFEIRVNDEIVNDMNYENTLGKDNKFFSRIRNEVRQELTSIIQIGKIDSNQDTEIIDSP